MAHMERATAVAMFRQTGNNGTGHVPWVKFRPQGTAAMPDSRKIAFSLLVLGMAAATMMTRATAQDAVFSEAERLGLGVCLAKCRDGDKACNNRCISQSQTKGRIWSDDVRVCIRDCRGKFQGPATTDGIHSCLAGCRLDRVIQ
jgi:hypothetical protein